MRAAFVLAIVLLASACATGARPSFVPPPAAGEERLTEAALRALISEGVVECSNHRASDNTCDALSYYTLRGGTVINSAVVLLSAENDLRLTTEGPLFFRGDAMCVDFGESDLRVTSSAPSMSEVNRRLADEMGQVIRGLGTMCGAYTRTPDGDYRLDLWERGAKEPVDTSRSRFFTKGQTPPALRATSLAMPSES